jgi:hypothetical protein
MMEVIGEDGETYLVDEGLHGDVMGDVMGYEGPMGDFEGSALVGYDDEGEPIIVGVRHRRRAKRGRSAVLVRKPGWRKSQVAPGVIAPDQGMLSLPMPGQQGNIFTAAIPAITFQGELQKPFRGERLLVSVVRTGITAVGRLMGQIFVGTDLQQGDIPQLDIENLGNPGAFGVRLTMKPAQPGVKIRIQVTLSAALTSPDTIFADVQLLGRIVQ